VRKLAERSDLPNCHNCKYGEDRSWDEEPCTDCMYAGMDLSGRNRYERKGGVTGRGTI
jgi:hypothetical protein